MRSAIVITLALCACSKDGAKGPTSRDGVIAAWKKGGLEPSEFKPAKVGFGKDCAQGIVSKVDVLVCTFKSEAEAKAAEDPALEWVGDTGGVAKALGEMLVVTADRKKADVNGKVQNQLITLPAK